MSEQGLPTSHRCSRAKRPSLLSRRRALRGDELKALGVDTAHHGRATLWFLSSDEFFKENTRVEDREVPMMATFEREVRRAIAEVKQWPEIDLFRQPP